MCSACPQVMEGMQEGTLFYREVVEAEEIAPRYMGAISCSHGVHVRR